ncbi:MAG: methionyl-tRNA formyltransferase [Clostridiales bacterium]|nr:methionyl-tRNA formyltransferase [Clostridiales bacterium]
MKIVFFGTGKFSATVLEGLLNQGREIVGVVTQPDKVNGRNNKVIFSDIKKLCLEKNLPLFQFAKLNLEGEEVLKELNADIFVTASYGQIIKQNILDIPRFGTINVHASLLPKYRGPAPIQWAIMNGETKTGVTIMKTELGLDTGDIYLKREIDIMEDDTSSSVFNKLALLGIDCLDEFFNNFEHYKNNHIPQNDAEATYFPMFKKEDFQIDFSVRAKDVLNKIRALEGSFFVYRGMRFKVFTAKVREEKGKAGEILACSSKLGFIVATKDKSLEILEIQPEGKSRMDAKSYMNSNKFVLGDIIENS